MPCPLLITGATGTLGRAFARICDLRGLDHCLTSRAQLEIAETASVAAALERFRPWAVINTAGYFRGAGAGRGAGRCLRENCPGGAHLPPALAGTGVSPGA